MKIATHNGKITIKNPKGDYRTFKIRTMKKDSKFAPGSRIIELLTGPNNEEDYQGFGFINEVNGKPIVKLWRSKESSVLFRRFKELMENDTKYSNEGYEYLHEVKCRCCNRTLTTPDSVKLGIGPECRNKQC